MGSLAMEPPVPGTQLQGILVKRNFNYHILAPEDLNSGFSFYYISRKYSTITSDTRVVGSIPTRGIYYFHYLLCSSITQQMSQKFDRKDMESLNSIFPLPTLLYA